MCRGWYTNSFAEYSGTVIPNDWHLYDSDIPDNAYFISNNITENRSSVSFYLQIGSTK